MNVVSAHTKAMSTSTVWSTSFEASTTASPAAVWAALRALHTGRAIGPSSDRFEPTGPFAVGTVVRVTPQGAETMDSVITELEAESVYADRTEVGGLVLTFRHVLLPTATGTLVSHVLEIDGEGAEAAAPQLGPAISADFPVAMAELFDAAERGIA